MTSRKEQLLNTAFPRAITELSRVVRLLCTGRGKVLAFRICGSIVTGEPRGVGKDGLSPRKQTTVSVSVKTRAETAQAVAGFAVIQNRAGST